MQVIVSIFDTIKARIPFRFFTGALAKIHEPTRSLVLGLTAKTMTVKRERNKNVAKLKNKKQVIY
jgi:hypothetical protein